MRESPVGPPIILSEAFGVIVILYVAAFPELVSLEPTSTIVNPSPADSPEPAGKVIDIELPVDTGTS